MPLPNDYPELPYKTPGEMIDAFKAGVEFTFVRQDSLEPVLEMSPGRGSFVRCLDKFSTLGRLFSPNGRLNDKFKAVVAIALAEHVWAKPEAKAKAKAKVKVKAKATEAEADEITTIRPSDMPGIEAAQAAAPMTPAPAFMVAMPKSADGLGVVHNPDKKFVWGA